jgi:hypothetical protein
MCSDGFVWRMSWCTGRVRALVRSKTCPLEEGGFRNGYRSWLSLGALSLAE